MFRRRSFWLIAISLAGIVFGHFEESPAATLRWNDAAGGIYQDPLNWTPNGVPTSVDTAQFDIPPGAYVVTMNTNNTTQFVRALRGFPTLNLNGRVFNTTDVFVGSGTSNGLTITGGGVMNTARTAFIGPTSSSGTGTVTVGGTTWKIARELRVGNTGSGFVHINSSGVVDVTQLTSVGAGVLGRVQVNAGGLLKANGGLVVANSSSAANSRLIVNGGGATTQVTGPLTVGLNSRGFLTVNNGGTVDVTTSGLDVARSSAAAGSRVDIGGSGATSTVNLFKGLNVGTNSAGTATINKFGVVNSTGGSVGTGTNASGSSININSGGTWNNSSSLTIGAGTGRTGTVNVGSGGLLNTAGVTRINTGSALNLNGGTIDHNGGDIRLTGGNFVFTKGVLKNVRTFTGDLQQAGGTLAAGASPGLMAIAGNYDLSGGALEVEILDTSPGGFDRYSVSGVATLTGDLDVALLPGYVPTAGDSFTFLTASQIVGSFGNVFLPSLGGTLFWDLDISSTSATLNVLNSVVPEPSGIVLFSIGLVGLGGFVRRKQQQLAAC